MFALTTTRRLHQRLLELCRGVFCLHLGVNGFYLAIPVGGGALALLPCPLLALAFRFACGCHLYSWLRKNCGSIFVATTLGTWQMQLPPTPEPLPLDTANTLFSV